jgi:signal transduction histidine kinase
MKYAVVKNPLTYEEQASAAGLLGHDLENRLAIVQNAVLGHGNPTEATRHIRHFWRVTDAVYLLSRDEFLVSERSAMDVAQLAQDIQYAPLRQGTNVSSKVTWEKPLVVCESLVFVALYNMVKNALDAGGWNKPVNVTIAPFEGAIPGYVRLPESASPSGEYVRFAVTDTGPGFPSGSLDSFFEQGVSTKGEGRGFGLHVLNLVSKVLKAPIGIETEPRNTTVSLYHPLNL